MTLLTINAGIFPVVFLMLFLLISNLPYSKATFSENCTISDNCTQPNETCSVSMGNPGVCVCAGGFYYNNGSGSGGLCEQKVGLGSNCPQPDACNDTNAVCNSGKCACGTGYYDSNGVSTLDGTCTPKVGLGSNCPQPDACNDTNAVCNSGKCACGTGYYDSNGVSTLDGTCTPKVGLGSNCPQPDACNDTNAVCNSGKCACGTGYYDSNGVSTLDGTCTPKVGLGSNCPQPDACNDTNAVCNSGKCACGTGYYDSNGVSTLDGTCTPKVGLGSNCPQPDACNDTNAVCNSGKCACGTGYYDSNGVSTLDGTCTPKVGLGSNCPQPDACNDTNAVCNSGKCACGTGYYDSNGVSTLDGTCTPKVGLGSNCPQPDACNDTNAVCNSGKCACGTGYYDSNGVSTLDGTCTPKVGLGSNCPQPDACNDTNAVCNSGKCACGTGYYDSNGVSTLDGTCTPKVGLGSNCPQPDACNDTNAVCNSGKCACGTGYYDSNGVSTLDGTCTPKVGLGSNCPQPDACNDTNAVCNSGKCACGTGYYDSNGVSTLDGTCTPKVGLGSNCPQPDACNDTNAVCNSGKCACGTGYYDSNGVSTLDGTCTPKVGLGSNCPQPDACNDTNAVCNSGKCACGTGYYDSNGVSTLDGTCTPKVSLGLHCPQPDACRTANAFCGISPANVVDICVCSAGYYDSDGETLGGTCNNVTNLNVQSISYGAITVDSIPISWTAPADTPAVNYYVVEHRSADSNDSSAQNVMNTSAILRSLSSGRRYYINITSVNTQTSSSLRATSVTQYQVSRPSIPGSLVQNMDIEASSGNIILQWNRSVGVVTGYVGTLENTTLFSYNKTFNTSGITPSQSFSDLKNGTWYMFNVQGISGYSDTMTLYSVVHTEPIKTKVQAPDPPFDIQCSERNDRYIQLTWRAPLNPNGDLRHYIINVNMTSPSQGIAYNVTTKTADLYYKVENLTEGSYHMFQIYTVNEQFESASASQKQFCETRPRMSESPKQLSLLNTTSRSFTISWDEPNNVFGELVGYILIITNTETNDCLVEEFTNCSTGCRSVFPNQTVVSPTCNPKTTYQSVNQTELRRTRDFTALFGTFNPDTIYKVSVVAVNQGGRGNKAEMNVTTLEEAPQKPYNIQVTDIQATNATVVWSIAGPRPGKTNYTIIVTGDSPAKSMTSTVSGFSSTSFNITGLQAYWNYSLIVTASTGKGSNPSDSVTLNTKVAPAGKVSKFSVAEGSGGDKYATSIVSWSLPDILERNGPIKHFIVQQEEMLVNGTFSEQNKRNIASVNDESNTYSTDFQVQREHLYRFNVFAYNGFDGAMSSMNFSASPVQTPSSVGALAGGIAGGAAALIIIVVIIIVLWRRKRNKLKKARRLSDDATVSNMENLTKIRKQRPINLATFAEYVADHHKDSNLKFSEEYEDLKTMSPQHPHEAADMEENRLKNRFVNILPFDHSRVKLLPIDDVPGSDYINANFLPGFSKTREYIACQGPIPATIDDHWRLTWEQNVRVIVMLTQYKEENRVKCEPYMPLDLKDPKQYGDLVVECLTYSSMNSFEYRTLKIKLGDKERTLKHFHFLSWRDYSANVQFDTMIDFIKKVRGFIQPPDLEGPMIVHCSAGVGRTGTYITIDNVIQHIDKYGTDSTVDIFNFVLKMRENRTTMVQTEQQYIFIHDCIKEYLDRFKTYENQAFSNEEENLYQNTETNQLYENYNHTQKTEL